VIRSFLLLSVLSATLLIVVACDNGGLVPIAQNGATDSGGDTGGSLGCMGTAPDCYGTSLQSCCGQDPSGPASCQGGQWMCGGAGAPGCDGRRCVIVDSGPDSSTACVGSAPNCFGNDAQGCCGHDPSGVATCQGGQWMCGGAGAPGCNGTPCIAPSDGGASDVASDVVSDVNVICPSNTCLVNGTCQAPTGPQGNGCCMCTGDTCTGYCVCASPDTPVATPDGDRPISSLQVGDLVYSEHRRALVPVPLREVARTRVHNHVVAQVTLESGIVLRISAPHPTADGRTLGSLRPGDQLDGVRVAGAEIVPYDNAYTYDILPDSDTGTYVAGGVLIGTTLGRNDGVAACSP
jgi:hypothetical protein